jgi:hypothetical protein
MKKKLFTALLIFILGACASEEVREAKQKKEVAQKSFKQKELKPFVEVSTWKGWLCADFIDETRTESVWYRPSIGKSDMVLYDQNCAYWESHPPENEN